jgi:hypothetical protein
MQLFSEKTGSACSPSIGVDRKMRTAEPRSATGGKRHRFRIDNPLRRTATPL